MPVAEILKSRAELFTAQTLVGQLNEYSSRCRRSYCPGVAGKIALGAVARIRPKVAEKDVGLFKELCFGTLRWYPAIELIAKRA